MMANSPPKTIVDRDVNITGNKQMYDPEHDRKYTAYVIEVREGDTTWTIFRRYNQFLYLHNQFKHSFRVYDPGHMPQKKWFGNFNPGFVAKRQDELRALLKYISWQPELARSREFHIFLSSKMEDSVNSGKLTEADMEDLKKCSHFHFRELEALYQKVSTLHPEHLLNEAQFTEVIHELGLSDDSNHLLFRTMDLNKSGSVDFREIIVGLSALMRGTQAEKAEFLFRLFDLNSDGSISKEEVFAIVMGLDKMQNNLIDHGEARKSVISKHAFHLVEEVFSKIDTNKDGSLQFDEFLTGLQHFPELFDASHAFELTHDEEGAQKG